MATGDINHCVMKDNIPHMTMINGNEKEEPVKQQRGNSSYRFDGCSWTAYYDVNYTGSVRTAGLNLENQILLDHLRKNKIKSVKEIMAKNQIPNKRTTITAITECGYNKSIRCLLKLMAKMLRNEIPNSVGSWCGYRPQCPNRPVFVVTLKHPNYVFDKNKIRKPFCEYDIIMRFKNVPNEEEKTILENTGTKLIRSEDCTRVHICIAQNTKSLMQKHNNLSIIRANCVKSSGYLNKTHQLAEETCIVLSVPVKGVIPIGENEFPKSIDGIKTDVREGEFVLFADHNATGYHHHLRMGCCISRPETNSCGTLGGFVDLPGNRVGCLTAAHVVLTEDEINQCKYDQERRGPINYDLKCGQQALQVYQPYAHTESYFGNVHTVALKNGNTSVDAAIIAITNDNRNPDRGNFPMGDFSDAGFPIEKPMMFNSGKILDSIPSSQRGSSVIKFGSATGITRGVLGWNATSVREVTKVGKYCFPAMYGQIEITSPGFAEIGDSGALAFICYGGNVENLHAIGMIIGGSSTDCSTVITPIGSIFHELGLSENRFKAFPPNIALNDEKSIQDIADDVDKHGRALEKHNENFKFLSERITSMEKNINQRVDTLENRMKDEMMKGFQGLQQLLLANPR